MLAALTMAACLWHLSSCYIEVVEEHGQSDTEFHLTCRHLEAHMAILDAQFTPHEEPTVSNISTIQFYQDDDEPHPIRLALNYRCSGVNHCSFILHADCPGSKYWGPGDIYIRYACMTVWRITKYCNSEVVLPVGGGPMAQGFISTPGYPKFYVGQSECRWRIRAPLEQKIQLTLLDVSLSVHEKYVGACEDELVIQDDNTDLLTTCAEREQPPVLVSDTNTVHVAVKGRSGSLVPKRGVLFHYKAIGCPTLPAPTDGYFVYRNDTHAHYVCCVGFRFEDTRQRDRVLTCLENKWDLDMPSHCVRAELENTTYVTEVTEKNHKMIDDTFITDILIPSILMIGLILGNAIIVFIIYNYRKRKVPEQAEEELGTMVPQS